MKILYIATSLDGYIATTDGAVDWLERFDGIDYGYDDFISGISTIVMGRITYEQVKGFGEWPYKGRRVFVLGSKAQQEPDDLIVGVFDDADRLNEVISNHDRGNTWILGGAKVTRAFLDLDAIDRIDLFVMPLLLGSGIRLFDESNRRINLRLSDVQHYPNGVVRTIYDREP